MQQKLAALPPDKQRESQPVTRPFVGDLVVVYVFDSEASMRFVSGGDVAELGLAPNALHELAIENMSAALGQIPVAGDTPKESIHAIATGDSYDAARMLLLDRWQAVAAKFSGPVIAAVPSRDMLLFADGGHAQNVEALAVVAKEMHKEAAYPLASTLFRFTGSAWEALPEKP